MKRHAFLFITIGCRTGANEENLKKMFSISRMSNAREYLLDETEPAEILQDILNGTDLIRVDIFPEDELCDGTRQPVRIGFGEDFCTVEAVMPFRAETPVAETNVPEKAVEEAEEVEQTTVVLTEEDTGFRFHSAGGSLWHFSDSCHRGSCHFGEKRETEGTGTKRC